MAKVRRFSGRVKVELSYNDRTSQYRARVCPMVRNERCETVYIGTPKTLTESVDSPRAYDRAAHAAISFSRDDIQSYADVNRKGSGWVISRGRRSIWPRRLP